MSDKPSKFELIQLFAAFAVIVTIYTVVSQFVLNCFWNLVIKLFKQIFSK